MAGVLIDTDVLVDYLAGVTQAADLLEYAREDLSVSALSITELLTGVRNEAEQSAIDAMLAVFTVIPVDEPVARKAAQLRRELVSAGITTGACLIAATALVHDLRLVTLGRRSYPLLRNLHIPYRRLV